MQPLPTTGRAGDYSTGAAELPLAAPWTSSTAAPPLGAGAVPVDPLSAGLLQPPAASIHVNPNTKTLRHLQTFISDGLPGAAATHANDSRSVARAAKKMADLFSRIV